MNRTRRTMLQKAVKYLDLAGNIIDNVLDNERDCLDNMPENLQGSDRYLSMESAVDSLEDALESVEEVKSHIASASA